MIEGENLIQNLRNIEFQKRLGRISQALKQNVIKHNETKDRLHIVYVMTHVGVSGGVKVIFEHANRLTKLGVKVTIVAHYEKPTWFPIEAEYIQVPFDLELAKGIPNCDVIVATYWDHIQTCIETGIAPVVYFEQGDFHLFDYENMNPTFKHFIQKQFQIPPFIYTVSSLASKLIQSIYGRKAQVYSNAIDEKIFTFEGRKEIGEHPYLLMMGRDSTTFKGISYIIDAYEKIKNEFELNLYWITPEEPSEKMKERVTKCFINPSQESIASLYRGAALYVSGSIYESFSLPPLEAMACGCPVVTTNNEGVLEYAKHKENALICQMNDSEDMAEKIKKLLSNPKLKEKLIRNGLETANRYNWNQIMINVLHYYEEIANFKVLPSNQLSDWHIHIQKEHCLNLKDFIKFEKFLLTTNADIIKVPVIYQIDQVSIARWETVAVRKNMEEGIVETCFCPVYPSNKFTLYNLKGYQSFLGKQFEKALDEFQTLQQNGDEKEKAVFGRWVILTLMRLQRKEEAKRRLKELISHYPYNGDLYKLQLLLEGKNFTIEQTLKILGDATSYPEFFYENNSTIKEVEK